MFIIIGSKFFKFIAKLSEGDDYMMMIMKEREEFDTEDWDDTYISSAPYKLETLHPSHEWTTTYLTLDTHTYSKLECIRWLIVFRSAWRVYRNLRDDPYKIQQKRASSTAVASIKLFLRTAGAKCRPSRWLIDSPSRSKPASALEWWWKRSDVESVNGNLPIYPLPTHTSFSKLLQTQLPW